MDGNSRASGGNGRFMRAIEANCLQRSQISSAPIAKTLNLTQYYDGTFHTDTYNPFTKVGMANVETARTQIPHGISDIIKIEGGSKRIMPKYCSRRKIKSDIGRPYRKYCILIIVTQSSLYMYSDPNNNYNLYRKPLHRKEMASC